MLKTKSLKKHLLLLVVGLLILAGCAKPPVAELEDARSVVAYAYASGASQHAPNVYLLADEALKKAEALMQQREYESASESLQHARHYSQKALALTVERKKQLEQERLAKLAEEKQLAEELRQAELLRKKQEREAREKALTEKKPEPPVEPEAVKPKLLDKVVVGGAENLMMIAAREEVYEDGMLWPLIYKANRDQIKDPKEIFPGQELVIPRDKSEEEIEAARREAEELKLF
ncbi:protein of unknown function [Malonomonas rubra DSM 5091]|uniref:LysM domain-containing protein n=1 Tax=Malonomonas rubra DSM 5091 TaxID=1122189 RepID=A0A1M6BNM4_MALRU|nr:DUF4398 domain-containing protein [Malonomonas rubra]SHI50148.1 protein of unknown function [Malonomonas rubra DSM 5091]